MTSKPYLLALDLGTSSIGYVAFEIDQDAEPTGILDLGVRVFPDGRDPKSKEPLAVKRRLARGMRRNRDRGQNRIRRLVDELIQVGLLPEGEQHRHDVLQPPRYVRKPDGPEEKQHRRDVLQRTCPYRARHLAGTGEVDANTLGRALFHLGRRRGFKSNRLSGDSEESDYKNKIEDLRKHLEGQTLGSYLYQIQQANESAREQGEPEKQKVVRFRGGETQFYADRQMYRDEFEQIKKVQGNRYLSDSQWEMLAETIFWQYPLKPVPKGKCRFYPEESRAHIDLPISHRYRIYQEVNALRYTSEGVEYQLDSRQKQALYERLHSQKTLSFKGMVKLKDQNKSPYFPSDASFNLDVGSRSGKLQGNQTWIELGKPEYLGKLRNRLGDDRLNDIVHYLIEPLIEKNGKQVIMEIEQLRQWLQQELPELTEQQVENLCNYRFKRDTASVSRKFMQQIVPVLRDQGLVYSDAVGQLEDDGGLPMHHSHFETGEILEHLPYYGKTMPESVWGDHPQVDENKLPHERDEDAFQYGKIANPTVHVALNQLRFVVNRVIDRLGGAPKKIHVELTRDLKNSKEARDRIAKQNAQNKKDNDRIRDFLKSELKIERPGRADFQKIKLWEELDSQGARYCVFSGKPIAAQDLFNGQVEMEHIVPFSRSYDDGMMNKTLAFKQENLEKGNRTPHEAFASDPDRYQAILRRALKAFGSGPKYDRFKEGAFEKFYGDDAGGDMIARQLNDTRYLSRKARQYLSCLCTSDNVISVNGGMTAVLRDVWQLNNFKNRAEGKYREDHRHHIVDAFVVGLTSRSLIKQLSTARSGRDQHREDLYHFLKARVQDIPELKKELTDRLNMVVASYKPDHTDAGSMFYDTAYGLSKDENGNILGGVGVTRKAPSALSFDEIFCINGTHHHAALLAYLTGGRNVQDKKGLKAIVGSDKELNKRAEQWSSETGVKKLRITVQNDSIEPIGSAPFKGYAKNSYAYCDVWKVPHKKDKNSGRWQYKYLGDFAAYSELAARKNAPEFGRPHPAAKKLMRLYKQDMLMLVEPDIDKPGQNTEACRYMRVAGFKTDNRLDLRPNLQATNPGRKFESINTLFSNYRIHKMRS